MFNKTTTAIGFDDVESFCRERNEGVLVEYKKELIDNIPKAVFAFANTLGGILVMGLAADKETNNKRSCQYKEWT